MTTKPLTFSELYGTLPAVACKRFGPEIESFISKLTYAILQLDDRIVTYETFLNIMADEQIDERERNWLWLRKAKGFERTMDHVIMRVSVTNFKCKHGRMPTLEELLGDNDGFEDFYNHQEACADYVEPDWPEGWSALTRRQAYQTFTDYMAGIYERACAEHSRARSIAYGV